MKYRFSPIKNGEKLQSAIAYIAQQTTALCKKIVGTEYPISYLTIFSHFDDEFNNLKEIVRPWGDIVEANNGYAVKLRQSIRLANGELWKVRIRQPDSERPQVGCNDFAVTDYVEFKEKYLSNHPNNLRLIRRPEYEMIEFFDPSFDILAYIVSKNL